MRNIPLFGSVLFFLGGIVLGYANQGMEGIAWILGLVCVSIHFQSRESLKGFVMSTLVLAGLIIAFFYPSYLVSYRDFSFTSFIIPLIQLIMLGMGTTMKWSDFESLLKAPKAVGIGISAQLIIMPIVGWSLAALSGLPPEIAAGIILIGASPSGVASNVMAYLAKANVPLSITITSVATLIAPFVTPIYMKYLGGAYIEIAVLPMMWSIVKMILLPIGLGLLFNHYFAEQSKQFNRLLPKISIAGIVLIIMIITAAGRENLLAIGQKLFLLVLIHNLSGYALGYSFAKILGMPTKDAQTIALEVGMQNGGLASGIANSLGKITSLGLAPAVFGPLMNVTGSLLASFFQKNDSLAKKTD